MTKITKSSGDCELLYQTNSRKFGSVGYRIRLSMCACMVQRLSGHEVTLWTKWLLVHAIKETDPLLTDSKGYSIWQLSIVTSRRGATMLLVSAVESLGDGEHYKRAVR